MKYLVFMAGWMAFGVSILAIFGWAVLWVLVGDHYG